MRIFGLEISRERRSPTEARNVPISDTAGMLELFGVMDPCSLPAVTIDRALQVPAFSAAVTFLSGSLADMPLHAYRDSGDDGAKRLGGQLQRILNEAPNPEWSSFGWRQYLWSGVFTSGRGLSWIERGAAPGSVQAIWPMDPETTTVVRQGGRKFYHAAGQRDPYPAADVIDVPFLLKPNQLGVRSPVKLAAKPIQQALAMSDYASGFFAGGGVPPLALVGPMPAGDAAVKRAQADVKRAIAAAKADGQVAFPIPSGYELKPVGFDPQKGQMTEALRFLIEEIARVLNLPPVFVGDLTHGTFSNTEQQDLQLVKHVLARWAKALEEELNLKLFGAANNRRYVEHSLDGKLRGDFKSRMEGFAIAIQSGQLEPNEARAFENRPPRDGGGRLFIQGATVPIETQVALPPVAPAPTPTPTPVDGEAE